METSPPTTAMAVTSPTKKSKLFRSWNAIRSTHALMAKTMFGPKILSLIVFTLVSRARWKTVGSVCSGKMYPYSCPQTDPYASTTGSDAPKDDFLARNGLRYGKTYSFAIDMSKNGPTKGMWRDEFHRDPKMAYNGAQVDGKFVADKWEWDGEVKNFAHDIAWDFQDSVPGMGDHIKYWTGMGPDEPGCKCEHNTPVSMIMIEEILLNVRNGLF